MSIDVEALTNAVFYVYGNVTKRGPSIGPDRPGPREGHRPREFWEEDARLIAAEYARLVPAEDEGRLRAETAEFGDEEGLRQIRDLAQQLVDAYADNTPEGTARLGRVYLALVAALAATPEPRT